MPTEYQVTAYLVALHPVTIGYGNSHTESLDDVDTNASNSFLCSEIVLTPSRRLHTIYHHPKLHGIGKVDASESKGVQGHFDV